MQSVSTIISFIWPFTYLFIYYSFSTKTELSQHHQPEQSPSTATTQTLRYEFEMNEKQQSPQSLIHYYLNAFIKVAAQLICLPSSLQTLSVSQHWARAHRYPCDSAPCTSVVCSSPEIVTVGEDGRIVVFRADHEGVVQTIGKIRRGI